MEKKKWMVNQRSSGIIIFTVRKKILYFLLLHHGGKYWNFPKGKVEKGESLLETARRETFEETGIPKEKIRIISGFRESYVYHFRVEGGRTIHKVAVFYLGFVPKVRIQISSEHENFGWFRYQEALKLLFFKNSRDLIKKSVEFLMRNKKKREKP